MLWNELLRKGNYSLLQSQSDTQYCVCSHYDPNEKEDSQYVNGTYFCYWGDKEMQVEELAYALECFRLRTESEYISRSRLIELATLAIDGLVEDGEEEAQEYFDHTMDMEDYEKDFFGVLEDYDDEDED